MSNLTYLTVKYAAPEFINDALKSIPFKEHFIVPESFVARLSADRVMVVCASSNCIHLQTMSAFAYFYKNKKLIDYLYVNGRSDLY